MERYVVRHEFFGGLVYDRHEDTNILIDEDFYQALAFLKTVPQNNIMDIVGRDDFAFFESEGFLAAGIPNYRLIDSGHLEETLSAPGRVHFYYTSSCNLNCAHCFTKNAAVATEMSFDEKVNMLDQMFELGVNEILIGGGEPFTKSDFPDFVEACLSRDIITKVFTNGLLLSDKKLVERMANWNLKYMSISIDGADEEEYEKVRGIKGLSTIKRNLEELKSCCNFTIAASIQPVEKPTYALSIGGFLWYRGQRRKSANGASFSCHNHLASFLRFMAANLSFTQLFQLHPVGYLGQASILCITHGVFFLGIGKNPFNGFFSPLVEFLVLWGIAGVVG